MKKISYFKSASRALGLLTLMAYSTGTVMASAFGVSPATIANDHIKAGSTFTQAINLSTNETSTEKLIRITIQGDASLKNWISIPGEVVIPKGQSRVATDLNIKVPVDAALKRYSGTISFVLTPKSNKEGLDINLGTSLKLDLNVVSKEVVDYSINSLGAPAITEGDNLYLKASVNNNSNIELKELPVALDIFSQNEKTKIASLTGKNLIFPIPAYQNGEGEIAFKLGNLPANSYWIKAKVLKNNRVAYETRLPLEIAPLLASNSSINTSVRVIGENMGASTFDAESGSANVRTTLRVKSPYEDAMVYGGVTLIALMVAGLAMRSKLRK